MNMGVMTDRDACIELKFNEVDGVFTSIVQTIDHPDYPPVKGRIRMDILKASRCTSMEGGGLKFTEFSNFDMKGYFPMRMMNMFMGAAIAKSIPIFKK
jgi:hypothetical protein